MRKQSILYLLTVIILFASCSDSGNNPEPTSESSTVYVTNEGSFRNTAGTITSFDSETGTVTNKAFTKANNGQGLIGTVLQSGVTYDGKLYLSLNEPDKIEVVDLQSLSSIATIPVTTSVTALQVIDETRAYATNLYNSVAVDSVSVIDLESMQETDQRIAVGDQPRDIVQVGNRVFVANTGFSGSGTTISVIDTETNAVTKTIDVGIAPTKLVLDSNNQIWVVCNGFIAYDEDFNRDPENDKPGSIYLIDGESATAITNFTIEGHPDDLVLDENNSRGYLLDSGVKVISLTTRKVTETIFEAERTGSIFYSEQEELLYVGKWPKIDPFVQPGWVVRYDLNGAAVDSFQTGIGPNGFISLTD